jgi:NAD(P)-dependent dehydrogenase (short-subunit alcohol dehydrogenase family)
MDRRDKTALIAGASRGLGLALTEELASRGWRVIATGRRNSGSALHALADRSDGKVVVETLDVTSLDQIKALRHRLNGQTLDLVLANAGVTNPDVNAALSDVTDEDFIKLMLTNTLGPIRLLEQLGDQVPDGGVLAAMSSILGSLRENSNAAWPAYASSKAALNLLLHGFAAAHGRKRAVVAMCPGWVRTDMGGTEAALSIEESIPRVADVLTEMVGRTGLHYLNYDGREVQW